MRKAWNSTRPRIRALTCMRHLASAALCAVALNVDAAITPPTELTVTAPPGQIWGVSGGTMTKDFSECPMTDFIGTGNIWRPEIVAAGKTGEWGTTLSYDGVTQVPAPGPFGLLGGWVSLSNGCLNPSGWTTGGVIPNNAKEGATYSFKVRNKTGYERAFYGTTWRINEVSSFTVKVVVGASNTPPVASNTSLTTTEDTPASAVLPVTDNDTGDTHTFAIVTPPNNSHGTASISGNRLIFTPQNDWYGTTSLTYKATDAAGADSNVATVTITVTPVNDPPVALPKTRTIGEDTSGTVTLTATDIDSPAPTVFQIVTAPNAAHGTASISGSTLTFTPKPNWYGNTSLTYRAQDSSGAWSAPATVSITVNPVNDPPVAQAKSLTTDEDTPGTVTLSATDIDSPTPTVFQIVTAPNAAHGTASISGSALTFTPKADWNGSTSLTYRAQDSSGAWSTPATVSITVNPVNDPPVAQAKSLTIDEDSSGTVTLSATDIDSPAPTVFQIVTAPNAAHGTASISGSTLTFTPKPDWNGSTSLTYRAQDSAGAWAAPATVTIIVKPVNDQPKATSGLKISTKEGVRAIIRTRVFEK